LEAYLPRALCVDQSAHRVWLTARPLYFGGRLVIRITRKGDLWLRIFQLGFCVRAETQPIIQEIICLAV
jgi:hypothetical protein